MNIPLVYLRYFVQSPEGCLFSEANEWSYIMESSCKVYVNGGFDTIMSCGVGFG